MQLLLVADQAGIDLVSIDEARLCRSFFCPGGKTELGHEAAPRWKVKPPKSEAGAALFCLIWTFLRPVKEDRGSLLTGTNKQTNCCLCPLFIFTSGNHQHLSSEVQQKVGLTLIQI